MNPFRSAIWCACCGSTLRLNFTRKELVNTLPAPPVANLLPMVVVTTRQQLTISRVNLATIVRQYAYEDSDFSRTVLVQIISLNPIFMGCFMLYICVLLLLLLLEIGMKYTVATRRTQSFLTQINPVYVCMRGKFRFKNQ